jgi:DNA invertase Pin-like site-specific DNA recombinase
VRNRQPPGELWRRGARRIDREAVQSLYREGKGPTEIAKALGISRMHAYRLIKAMEAGQPHD